MPTGINSSTTSGTRGNCSTVGFTDPICNGGRFQNPLPQVPFFLLADSLNLQVAQALLGAMAGVAAVLTRRIAMRVLPFDGGWQVAVSTGAAVLAMVVRVSAVNWPGFSDVLLASLLLGGLLLILRAQPLPSFTAGLLAGAAVGSNTPAHRSRWRPWSHCWSCRGLGSGGWSGGFGGAMIGWLVTGAAWALNLWRTYDSPVFPFWNTVFGSPWFPGENLTDDRYGVSGLGQWLQWPWAMATGSARVLDLPVRDPAGCCSSPRSWYSRFASGASIRQVPPCSPTH